MVLINSSKLWNNFTTFTVMYRQQVITKTSPSQSFTLCLPGYDGVFPADHQCSQGDYFLSLKPPLELKSADWTVSLRSVCYSNSYSTFVPETAMKRLYMMADTDYEKLIQQRRVSYMLTPGVKIHNIGLHGFVLWSNDRGNDQKVVNFRKGLYYHLDEIIFELNNLYKSMNVSSHFRRNGEKIELSLKRDNDREPWCLPYFENQLSERVGMPHINSPEMIAITTQLARAKTETTLILTPQNVVRDKRRNIGLYIDFLKSRFPGLEQHEIIRLPGRNTGRLYDTNIMDFKTPIPLAIAKDKIRLIRVTFKDEKGDIVNFPTGQNMITLEFKKNKICCD